MKTIQNDITEKFKIHLQQLGYNKSSLNMLPACVLDFLHYNNASEVKELNQEHIHLFYEYLHNRPHKRKTGALSGVYIHQNIYSLKVFFNWLEETRQITYNPISNLKFKRPKVNTREPLSQKEIQELFSAAKDDKERAILHLFYSCGLRRTEAENLNTSDIHFSKNRLYVREGKGAKRRAIPLTERVKTELETYLTKTREKKEGDVFIFNHHQTRMKGSQYNKTLKEIVQRTEIETRTGRSQSISLHHLRHSIATHLLENGLSLEFVRDFLGHSHLETTQIYTKVGKHQLKKLQQ